MNLSKNDAELLVPEDTHEELAELGPRGGCDPDELAVGVNCRVVGLDMLSAEALCSGSRRRGRVRLGG